MQISARYAAVLELITEIWQNLQPADNIIAEFFRNRRYIGSKDRKFIGDEVWNIIRHRCRLEFEAQSQDLRKILLVYLKNADLNECFSGGKYGLQPLCEAEQKWLKSLQDVPYPPEVEAECPQWIYQKCPDMALLKSLNGKAEADFRVNGGSREQAIARLSDEGLNFRPTAFSPWGVRCENRINLNNCMAYQDGIIEPQDEASQLVAMLADVRPEHKIIDYCCGAGGKSLTLGFLLHNRGTIEAHDIDEKRLVDLPRRATRLGISNIRLVKTEQVADDYDRFVIDAPCSGSGIWRRSPDAKFRLTATKLAEIVKIQSELLEMASHKLKSQGRIVYITCSVLPDENRQQIEKFCLNHPEFELIDLREVWQRLIGGIYPFTQNNCLEFNPLTTATDGFFVAVLAKK